MKNNFFEYYRPSEEEFLQLWSECIFVVDANVLLNLYRYSPETSSALIGILEQVQDRIWLPHQVAFEYHKNRLTVIYSQMKTFSKLASDISAWKEKILNEGIKDIRRNLSICELVQDSVTESFQKLLETIEHHKEKIPNYTNDDSILDRITDIFSNKLGNAYSKDILDTIYEEGKVRYTAKTPPGI